MAARAELLAEENRRLRREYVRSRRLNTRNAALGLAAVGAIAAVGGVLFGSTRGVLFALAGTGWVSAVLVYYLAPSRFVAVSVGEGIYDAHARTLDGLVDALGLADTAVYAPATTDGGLGVRLFVPQHRSFAVPPPDALDRPLVVTEDDRRRGLSVVPVASTLVREFETAAGADRADAPAELGPQLADALVDVFDLVGGATSDVQPDSEQVVVRVRDCEFGDPDEIDHPVPSFVATGLAVALDRPVTAETHAVEEGDAAFVVRCSWGTDTEGQ